MALLSVCPLIIVYLLELASVFTNVTHIWSIPMRPPSKRLPARSRQLALQSLEQRTVPAYNLTIDGDALTANVSSTLTLGTRTFESTGTEAVLDVDDIETALNAGEDVVVKTGPEAVPLQAGSISWSFNGLQDDLDYLGAATRSLIFRTDVTSDDSANIVLNNVFMNFSDNLNLVIDVTDPGDDSDIVIQNNSIIKSAASVTLRAGTSSGIVSYNSSPIDPMAESGDIDISAFSFQPTNSDSTLSSSSGNIIVNAKLDMSLAGTAFRAEIGTLSLNGAIDGNNDLTLYGNVVELNAAVGAVTPLNSLKFAGGDATFLSTIAATTVNVGDNVFDSTEATLSSAGFITGNVFVETDGNLSPAGSAATGSMNITGNLTYNFGDYDLDLGALPDLILVSGDLFINGGSLINSAGASELPGAGDVKIIDFGGNSAGRFDNAPLNAGLLLGSDAIRVTNYGPASTDVTIAKIPITTGGLLSAHEADGTGYTVRLTGAGELTAFTDVFGRLNVLAANTTLKSKIKLTTKANASNDTVILGPIGIRGDLGAFIAPNAIAVGGLIATATPGTIGDLKSLSFFQFIGNLNTPGMISAFTTKANAVPAISALAVGKIKVGLSLAGFGDWNITNGIGSITAGQINGLNVTAGSIGTIMVKGDKQSGLSGDINFSTFTLTGNDGTTKSFGLKTLTAKGSVFNSTFDIREGNVNSVTVGRFVNSNLYLDYTPGETFNTGGAFDLPSAAFRLGKFTTTAKTIGDTANPFNFAFSGSRVVADTIGTVRLSGLNTENGGVAMGFKSRSPGGSIRTKSTNGILPLNTNLAPEVNPLVPLEGDCFYLDV